MISKFARDRRASKTLKQFALIGVLVFSFCIFTFRLPNNPPGFFIDEAIYGFEAHTLLHTGGSSSSGEFLPRLSNLNGDKVRNHGLYSYFVIPFIAPFGTNESTVRLTSVFVSLVLLCVLFLGLKPYVSWWSILLAALWWSLTSWVFLVSRIGMEFIAAALMSTLALWGLAQIHHASRITRRHILWFDLSVIILFFVYHSGRIVAIGYLLIALVLLAQKRVPLQRFIELGGAGIAIVILSWDYLFDGSFFYRSNEIESCIQKSLDCFVKNIVGHFHFDPYFYISYVPSDFQFLTHSIMGTSLIPRPLAIFLLIGLIALLYRLFKKDFGAWLLLIAFLFGALPASLLIRGFDSYRSVTLLPILFILIIVGLDVCMRWIKRTSLPFRLLSVTLYLIGTIYFGINEAKILYAYEYDTNVGLETGWQYGYRQVNNYFLQHYEQFDTFAVTQNASYVTHHYIRFFDLANTHSKIKVMQLSLVDPASRHLAVVRTYDIDPGCFSTHKTIYYPNEQDVAFLIGTLIPAQTTCFPNDKSR